jgi:immune inhibitor A
MKALAGSIAILAFCVLWSIPAQADEARSLPLSKSLHISQTYTRGFTRAAGTVSGTMFVPVILVQFSDERASANHRPAAYRKMLFQTGYPIGPGSLRDYFRDQSGGLLDVNGSVTSSWLEMPRPISYYVGGKHGYQSSEPNDYTLVKDAVRAADATTDFCKGDADADGYVDTIFVVHAGAGAEETGKGLWSIKWSLASPYVTDDVCNGRAVKVSDFTLEPEEYVEDAFTHPDAPANMVSIGVFVHEFGHVLGLPDLYDTDLSSPGGVGPWDVMANGTYGFNGFTPWRPTPLSAWSRATLGWVEPRNVTSDVLGKVLAAIDTSHEGVSDDVLRLAPGGSATSLEYFLIEKRKRTGWAAGLPNGGFAIWHIDESRSDNDDDRRRLVQMVQADGRNELGRSSDFFEAGDAGDLFPGSTGNRTWGPSTSPSSNLYGERSSGLTVKLKPTPSGTFLLDLLGAG